MSDAGGRRACGGRKYSACVVTVSDRCFRGERADESGPALIRLLNESGFAVEPRAVVVSDDRAGIEQVLRSLVTGAFSLVVTTGGTGFSERDVTPEATEAVAERKVPGISEYMRMKSAQGNPRAILSRGVSAIAGNTLIVNLPGSPSGAVESLGVCLDAVKHGLDMLSGMHDS